MYWDQRLRYNNDPLQNDLLCVGRKQHGSKWPVICNNKYKMPGIILTNEGMERTVFPLGRAILLIGRDLESGILLDSDEISKNHASIVFTNNQYVIRDNGSANGTFVNGVKTTVRVLNHNDQISFGPYEFLVDLEGEESDSDVPTQEATRLDRSGQAYRRSVSLKPVKGQEASSSVQVMMAGKTTQHLSAEAVEQVAVAVAGTRKKHSAFEWIFATFCAVLTIAILAWLWVGQGNNKVAEVQQNVIEELRKANEVSALRIRKLEEDATRAQKASQQVSEDLKKSNAELSALKSQNAHAQEAARSAADGLKKTAEELSALKKKAIEPEVKPTEEIKPAAGPTREAVAAKLEPIKALPPLEYPPKVTIVKATEIPVVLNDRVAGVRKIPEGQSFPVLGTENDIVLVEMSGENVKISKLLTNFQSALEEVNLSRKQENERLSKERELLIDKMVKEEATAIEQSEKAKAEMLKFKVTLTVKVQEILNGGVLGATPSGVRVFLTGVDCNNFVVGENWQGNAYQMGIFNKPESDLKFRHYTADLKEFSAFKASGSSEEDVSRSVQEETAKKLKSIEAQVNEILNLIDIAPMLKDLETIHNLAFQGANLQLAHINSDNLVRTKGPKFKKAAALALECSTQPSLPPKAKAFFEHVIVLSEMCTESRLPGLDLELRRLDGEAINLKASFLITGKATEKKN